jgi:hypothetical protein
MYCRNCAPDIAACAASVLDADLETIELVAVDDGSVDATASVLAELSLEHPDTVRVVSHMNTQGVAASVADAVHAARGAWCYVLQAPDRVIARELLVLAEKAEGCEADLAVAAVAYDRSAMPTGAGDAASGTAFAPGIVEHDAIARTIYLGDGIAPGFEGKLFSAELLRHSASSLTFDGASAAQDVAVCALAAFKAERLVAAPDSLAAVAVDTPGVYLSNLGEVAYACSARYAAEAFMGWLARNGAWEEQSEVWTAVAHGFARRSLDTVLSSVEKKDWPQAAEMVLKAWGGAITGSCVLEYDEVHAVMAALVLSTSPSLLCSSRRPRAIACMVRSSADVYALEELLPELSAKGVSVSLFADEGVELSDETEVAQTLPREDSDARVHALDEALRAHEIDTLVTFETPVEYGHLKENVVDLLVARVRDVATVTVMSKQMLILKSWEALAATSALSVVAVFDEGAAGAAVAKALGARTCKAASLVSQLTLGSLHDVCLDEKFDAAMLLHAQHSSAQSAALAHAQEIENLERRLADKENEMKAQKERLEMELDEVQAELEESKAKGFRFGRPKK